MKSLLIIGPILAVGLLMALNALLTRRDLRRLSGQPLERVVHLRAMTGAFIDTIVLLLLAILLALTDALPYSWSVPLIVVIALADVLVRRTVLRNRAGRR